MASGNDCPECGKNIGIMAVFKAPLPNRIWCPTCRARLEYGGTGLLLIVAVVLTLVLAAAAGYLGVLLWEKDDGLAVIAMVGVLILGGALLEVGLVLELWYGGYQLQRVGKRRESEDADADSW